jgi:hypothetical protein
MDAPELFSMAHRAIDQNGCASIRSLPMGILLDFVA